MRLYHELLILIGKPKPDYVAEQISKCKERIAEYDSDIAVFNSDIHGTYAHLSRNSCLSEDFKNSFEQSYYEREILIQKRYRARNRLNKLEKILI